LPSEQINFRETVPAGTAYLLSYQFLKNGILTGGFMHFPPGCNAVVLVRIMLQLDRKGNVQQMTPVDDKYIALDQANWEFTLDEAVKKEDKVLVEMINQGAQEHQISVIVTQEYPSPAQVVEERKRESERRRLRG